MIKIRTIKLLLGMLIITSLANCQGKKEVVIKI